MLIVLAIRRAPAARARTGRGNLSRSASINPRPVTMPIRAHMISTAAISGHVTQPIQSRPVPRRAPASE
jgi:hypothetical protein